MNGFDVVGLGELLIDLTQNGVSEQGNPVLEANPGGAPCNVLSFLAKLGHKTAFVGKVGRDGFGSQLQAALREVGIDDHALRWDDAVHTTLAIVHTLPGGDRDFSFYRKPGADTMLCAGELDEDLIRSAKIFHFGTLSMTDEPCRSATRRAIELAKQAGVLCSFDPNLREPLWPSLDEAKKQTLYGLAQCDILKISDNEIQWLTGEQDFDAGVEWLRSRFPNVRLLLLSLGSAGSRAYSGSACVQVPAFRVNTIETTGAGDTFFAGVLHHVLQWGLQDYTEEQLREMLTFANAAAALVTTRKGALRVMPTAQQVTALITRGEQN